MSAIGQSGHLSLHRTCPLSGVKRTSTRAGISPGACRLCYIVGVPGALFWFAPLQRHRTRSPSCKAGASAVSDVRFWHLADIGLCAAHVRFGVKRTCHFALHMSAFDPKRTFFCAARQSLDRPLRSLSTGLRIILRTYSRERGPCIL